MPKKTKLHLQDLNVSSFITGKSVKGGTISFESLNCKIVTKNFIECENVITASICAELTDRGCESIHTSPCGGTC